MWSFVTAPWACACISFLKIISQGTIGGQRVGTIKYREMVIFDAGCCVFHMSFFNILDLNEMQKLSPDEFNIMH